MRLIALLLSLLFGADVAIAQQMTERSSDITRLTRAAGGLLRIEDPHAAVEVRFVDRPSAETQIQVIYGATDATLFDQLELVVETDESGLLSIDVVGPSETRGSSWRVELIDITMTMPDRIEIDGGQGDVGIFGFAPATPGPASKPVEPPVFGLWMDAQEPSRINTTDGDITLGRCRGPFVLRSTRGDISAEYHRGAIDIQSDFGDVTALGLVAPFGVWANRGDVEITVIEPPAGGIRALTTRGRIEIGEGVSLLDATTPLRRRDGEIVSIVTTSTGDIEIRRITSR
ncbi:MAG: hypothetical protein AAGB51_01920 [Planctomycetota bacterium]